MMSASHDVEILQLKEEGVELPFTSMFSCAASVYVSLTSQAAAILSLPTAPYGPMQAHMYIMTL